MDHGARMGERTFLNTLEQMGPFLAAAAVPHASVFYRISRNYYGVRVLSTFSAENFDKYFRTLSQISKFLAIFHKF